jgi:hypothetical protein
MLVRKHAGAFRARLETRPVNGAVEELPECKQTVGNRWILKEMFHSKRAREPEFQAQALILRVVQTKLMCEAFKGPVHSLPQRALRLNAHRRWPVERWGSARRCYEIRRSHCRLHELVLLVRERNSSICIW